MDKVKLIECINTFQAEGPDSGKRMLICRFKYCNRVCPWCDTLVKMRVEQEGNYDLTELQTILDKEKTGLLITGGEPTLDTKPHSQFESTALMLNELNYPIANVETNGYALQELIPQVKRHKYVRYIYSPKFFKDSELAAVKSDVENYLNVGNVCLKIVCEDTSNMVDFLEHLNDIGFDNSRIYLMPQGKTRDELLRNSPIVFDMAEEYKFNFSSRQHIIYDFV